MASHDRALPGLDLSTASRTELVARIQQLESARPSHAAPPRSEEPPAAAAEPSPPLSKSAARRLLKQQAILELAGQQQQQRLAAQKPSEALPAPSPASSASDTAFFNRYGTRKIALKFSYEGWPYSGLALQDDTGPLPTVEGVLLDALVRARLIRPEQRRDLEGLGFARCGRTDRGVSAAGQVVNLWVRSQLAPEQGQEELAWRPPVAPQIASMDATVSEGATPASSQTPGLRQTKQKQKPKEKDGPRSELPYMALLNRCLPPSIRVHGWSPVSEDFDARFSCTSRHYKYFFSTPCGGAHLDVRAMQDAADRLVGEHDFRNLCKVDPTKQIVNFQRGILEAHISPLGSDHHSGSGDTANADGHSDSLATMQQLYVFDLKGTAFLYHQVRHIMAVLFLVGSGREDPSVVDRLLTTGYGPDTSATGSEGGVVASKPVYEMADDLPLVLWDCTYPVDALPGGWRQGDEQARAKAYNAMEEHTAQLQLRATIAEHFGRAFSELPTRAEPDPQAPAATATAAGKKEKTVVQIGGGKTANTGKYVPLLQRPRGELVEVINKRWADGQGRRKAERKAAAADARAGRGDANAEDAEDAMSIVDTET